ncbi:MAG TPA: hypothetical protein VMR81_06195 [Patescibacteria group bacterium]|nr:hypothetical protein [Patescibacteria group bacterium]
MKAELTPQGPQTEAITTIRDTVGRKLSEALEFSAPGDLTKCVMRHVEPKIDDKRFTHNSSSKEPIRMPLLLISNTADKELLEGITVTLEQDNVHEKGAFTIKSRIGHLLTSVELVREGNAEMRIMYPDSFSFGDIPGFISRLLPNEKPPEKITYLGLWVTKRGNNVYADAFTVTLPIDQVQLAMPADNKGWLFEVPKVEPKVVESVSVNKEPKHEIDFTEPEALAAIQKWQQSPKDFFLGFWNSLNGVGSTSPEDRMSRPLTPSHMSEPRVTLAISGIRASVVVNHMAEKFNDFSSHTPTTDMIILTIQRVDYSFLQKEKIRSAGPVDDAKDLTLVWTKLDNGRVEFRNYVEWRNEENQLRQRRDVLTPEQMAGITGFLTVEPVIVYERPHLKSEERKFGPAQYRRGGRR